MLHAAVVIPLLRRDEPAIVFVRRAAHLRRNPGQIAFPGGAVDAADKGDSRTTALREFEEELGVPRERVEIVDKLDDVLTVSLGVRVTPYLGTLTGDVQWTPDGFETESVHEVPLWALYAAGALHWGTEIVTHEGQRLHVKTWIFDHAELHVWGATARMLHAMLVRYPEIELLPLVRS